MKTISILEERINYFLTHKKVKLLADLAHDLLIKDQCDARETQEILAENIALLMFLKMVIENLLDVASGKVSENMLREINEEQKQEKEKHAAETQKAMSDCAAKPERVVAI